MYDLLEEYKVDYSGILLFVDCLKFRFYGRKIGQEKYQNKTLPNYKKTTLEQRFEIARLGAMRVIGLKKKLIKSEFKEQNKKQKELI